MIKDRKRVEKLTGTLFGKLFPMYDNTGYMRSIELFSRRFKVNKFPLEWFKDKTCLDAGCGGGRYSLALSMLGARKVYGADVSKAAIKDARKRAAQYKITNIEFRNSSVEKLPFKNNSFDFIVCSGVVHHTSNPEKSLAEISRVLRPGGGIYMLMYATGGVRWPLVQILRPLAQEIGFNVMDKVCQETGMPPNKRRTYLDDLFVPVIDFYTWGRLKDLLIRNGFTGIKRWEKGRFDHEEDLDSYLKDLKGFYSLFKAGAASKKIRTEPYHQLFCKGRQICKSALDLTDSVQKLVEKGDISEKRAMQVIVGQGHHRIIAWKGSKT